jgi:hypothetical protein
MSRAADPAVLKCPPQPFVWPSAHTRYATGMVRQLALLLVVACGPGGEGKPTGTTSDPVDTCERVADVCRIDRAKLGVCSQRQRGSGFVCASQH